MMPVHGPTDNANWILGCAAFVDYEGKELASFTAAVAYSESTGRDVCVNLWWEGLEWEEPEEGWRGRAWWNGTCVSVPSTSTIIIIITTSIVSIATIINTIATSITAAGPTFFGLYLRRVFYWEN
jgi:hypothetical protein